MGSNLHCVCVFGKDGEEEDCEITNHEGGGDVGDVEGKVEDKWRVGCEI